MAGTGLLLLQCTAYVPRRTPSSIPRCVYRTRTRTVRDLGRAGASEQVIPVDRLARFQGRREGTAASPRVVLALMIESFVVGSFLFYL